MEPNLLPSRTALASLLESRLQEWDNARKPQEQKLLECYQDYMRISREDDTKGTGTAKTVKTKSLFIGSTRNKIRSASAKINDALFGNGQMPFDTIPANEELKEFADVMEDIVTDQMERGGFKESLSTGVDLLATYGTGFMFGPFVRKEKLTETSADGMGGIQESEYEYDLPYFELASTLDVIPDCEARDVKRALGIFWVTMESPHTVASWKNDPAYKDIDQALVGGGGESDQSGSELASEMRGNVEYWHANNRIKVARYFGKVPRSSLKEQYAVEVAINDEMVDVIAIMAGGVVVKLDEMPYTKCPAYRCLYEAVANEMWGVGVAENNAPHQKVTNAAFRLFMEGKGMALLGTKAVDRSKFLPTEDFKKFPGKVYQFKPGLSADEKKAAIMEFIEADITGGWRDVIAMSEQFSDDDTGITKYTQGDDSRNLNKTASGISMIMSAASLPTKKIIQNIDCMWIEPSVEAYVNWNLKYLEVETVMKIHGEKHAQAWAKIKEFGKTSFMKWKATGTASFMAKEVLTNKLRAFLELAISNEKIGEKVDIAELLRQYWSYLETGMESPILEDDYEEKMPPQAKAKMQEMQEQVKQMGGALENASTEVDKLEAAKATKDAEIEVKRVEANTKAYDAVTKRLQVVGNLLTPAEVSQLAAETQREAMAQPDPGMAPSESMAVPEPTLEEMQAAEMPQEMAEPMPEEMEPPGLPEPQPGEPQEMPLQAAPEAAFLPPDDSQPQQ